jgi:hypothetical protein
VAVHSEITQYDSSCKNHKMFVPVKIICCTLLARVHPSNIPVIARGCRGCDRMVVGFPTTCAISVYHNKCCEFEPRSGEVYSKQHYVIKFVSGLRQVGSFLRFPLPIKLTATI